MKIDFEIAEGSAFETVLLRMRATNERIRDEILRALALAANNAEKIMQAEIPRDSGVLASSIKVGPIRFAPGGAGGGGFYEVEVSVGESALDAGGIPYVQNVIEGTGIYGPKVSPIYPAQGNVMVFQKKGERTVFTRWTRGQQPNDLWLIEAQEAANEIIRDAVRRIDMMHEE